MPKRMLISSQRRREDSRWASNQASVVRQVKELIDPWRESTSRAAYFQSWYDGEIARTDLPKVPTGATPEQRALRDSSHTPWIKMIIDSQSQHLIFDDIRLKEGGSAPALDLIERNSLGSRAKPVHDGALIHGKAFNLILPGVGRRDGKKTAIIRGKSALNCDAFFLDDFDEYPVFFLEGWAIRDDGGKQEWRFDLYDEGEVHRLVTDSDFSNATLIESERHGASLCPAVRFAPNLSLTGKTVSEVGPYLSLVKRINQSTNDRLIVQRYGAFVIRWIAGIETPKTDTEKRAAAMALAVTDLLVSPKEDTKFGHLPGTPLEGYVTSREADIRDLSATSQVPSFHMLGLSDNVGAEGLAAAESAAIRKRNVQRTSLGESWETSFRLGGEVMDDPAVADDFSSRLHWVLTETYAFQSLAQGLGQLATDLNIPPQMLWRYIPDWNQEDTLQALQLLKEVQDEQEQEAEKDLQRQIELQTELAKVKGSQGGDGRAAQG